MRDKTQSEELRETVERPWELIAKRSNQDLLTALDLLIELTNVSKRKWEEVEKAAKASRISRESLSLVAQTTQAVELGMLTVAAELEARGVKVGLVLESTEKGAMRER